MKKSLMILAFLLGCLGLNAQNYHINLHNSGSVIYDHDVNTITEIRFRGSQPAIMVINSDEGGTTFDITQFDSITFYQPEAHYTITANANNDAWGSVNGGGVYDFGATCTLTATPASGYLFECWKKDNTVVTTHPSYSFTVTEDATYTAYFAETPVTYYTITTVANPTSGGTVTGGGIYPAGTSVTLTATANAGYTFSQWDDGNTQSSRTITVTGDATYIANFTQNTYTITTAANPTSGGSVTGGGTYHYGDTPTLTATPASGYVFVGWHDGNTNNPRQITVTGNATYTANFAQEPQPPAGDTVYIIYNGSSVTVTNPFSNTGVTVTNSGADVTVNSTRANVPYVLSGSSTNGSLTLYSTSSFYMALSALSLTSNTAAAINIASAVDATLCLRGSSSIADNANSAINGAFYTAGGLTINGTGTLQVTGNGKHGISAEGNMTVNSGTLRILDTDSDGIHGSSNLQWNSGTLDIVAAGSDGLDFSGTVTIAGGNLSINTTAETQRSIKVTGIFTMTGGTLGMNVTGNDCKGLKGDNNIVISGGTINLQMAGQGSNGISSDTDITISGNADITIVSSSYDGKCFKSDGTFHMTGGSIDLTHSGDISKGIKTVGQISITGGTIDITSSGSTVLETVSNQNVPAYCSAIKCDTDINIIGGDFTITLPTSNHGGKGISADGSITIDGGTFTITTQGNGASYTVSGNTKDAYTSACLRSDGNMSILSGSLTLSSSGTGGKGINVGDDSHTTSTLTLGTAGASNDLLTLNVTTSGERITVSSGGGGPWGGGDYANPKGVKSRGNLTINSGNITVHCTQTQNEGGECIESKATLTINGGNIEAYSVKDDAVNAAQNLTINGGTYYAHSDNNDGTDSNGTLFLNGGLNISNGARQPEEGFDCDNNQFKITGGTSIGTGGATSNPTTNVCTQPSLKINTQSGYAIQILKSNGTVICTYQCPTLSGGGGGGWPGGGSGLVMLFTDPQLQTGQSYTVKYGGTISGGTNWNGYYTGNVTYSGGQSTTVNVNSMVTTVSAGGGGW